MCYIDDNILSSDRHDAADTVSGQYNDLEYDDTPVSVTNSNGKKSKISYVLHCASEKAMAPHSSTLAWKIPWTEEPGGLQSMGSLRVGYD